MSPAFQQLDRPLFQVGSRAAGNATTNIGYDSNNVADETALAAAITGVNDGRTLRIYDQSGNGRDQVWQLARRAA